MRQSCKLQSVVRSLSSASRLSRASAMAHISPFTQSVFASMERLYPDALADKSFDNTGVLMEAPFDPAQHANKRNALLTIDLTTAVADEAIAKNASVIVTYHPIIFRALKSLRLGNTQQQSLLRLAANGISVYSPHTAVDAANGGNADWLSDLLIGKYDTSETAAATESISKHSKYTLHCWPRIGQYQPAAPQKSGIPSTRSAITPNKEYSGAGMGRIVTLDEPTDAGTLVENLARGLAQPKTFKVALPQGTSIQDHKQIRTIGVCAGSGASVVGGAKVDMIVTGEMVHHEALAAIEKGQIVVCLNHSNSERKYLADVMQSLLTNDLESNGEKEFNVLVSEHDKDPFDFVVLQ